MKSLRAALCVFGSLALGTAGRAADAPPAPPRLEGYSAAFAEALVAKRRAELDAAARAPNDALRSLMADNFFWPDGQELVVAFHGGSYPVWLEVSKIANQWSKIANIHFNFGLDANKKTARMWKPGDPQSIAAVRIELVAETSERWSAVGRRTNDTDFAGASMSLGGLATVAPAVWSAEDRADVLHEFGHVLGFVHEQQRAECVADFRQVSGGDGQPSIYDLYQQYFHWPPEKTRANLLLESEYAPVGGSKRDLKSIFLYPLPDILVPGTLHGTSGPCYIAAKNLDLSDGDRAAAQAAYPFTAATAAADRQALSPLPRFNLEETQKAAAAAAPGDAALWKAKLASLQASERPLVYIQIGDESQRAAATRLQAAVREAGFIAPGIENVGNARSPDKLQVRFFVTSDGEAAAQVFNVTSLAHAGEVALKNIPKYAAVIKRPTVEIWFPKLQPKGK